MANRSQDFGTITIRVVSVDEQNFTVTYKMLHDKSGRVQKPFVPFDNRSREVCSTMYEGRGYTVEQHCTGPGTMWVSAREAADTDKFKRVNKEKYQQQEEELNHKIDENIAAFFGIEF